MQQAHLLYCSLTSKYTSHSLLVSCFPLKALVISFSLSFSLQKRKLNILFCFDIAKIHYPDSTLGITTSKDINHTLFPELQTEKASVVLVCCFLFDWLPYLRFILQFLNAKNMRYTSLAGLQSPKTALLHLFKHFNT